MNHHERTSDEIHVFEGVAERTGVTIPARSRKTAKRSCTSLTDLVRKYKLYGDGTFYLESGVWPEHASEIDLDHVKWIGIDQAFRAERGTRKPSDDNDA